MHINSNNIVIHDIILQLRAKITFGSLFYISRTYIHARKNRKKGLGELNLIYVHD